jgi:hypothetical protein
MVVVLLFAVEDSPASHRHLQKARARLPWASPFVVK